MLGKQYAGKVIVAPMVRVGTLPFRLLALDYGADLVYTEETIDWKMLRSVMKENKALGTVDFVDKTDGTVFFRTCAQEKEKVIFQIGTSDPQRALQVGKMIEKYVAGLDVNMGCPKEFSLKGGMGAALLTQPEKAKSILTTLVQGLDIPVTCKVRLLPTLEQTLEFCRMVEGCGVAAIAVHGRTKEERPRHPNNNDIIREITKVLKIPVIANGGSKEMINYEAIEKFRQDTNSASVMVARAAMWNCSVLRNEGILPLDTVIQSYLKYCIDYDNAFTYTKYTVQNMLRDLQETPKGKAFLETQTLEELCKIWDLSEHFRVIRTHQYKVSQAKEEESGSIVMPTTIEEVNILRHNQDGQEIVEMPLQFIRGNFCNADVPKMILNTYVFKNDLSGPKFTFEMREKFFTATVDVGGIKYRSTLLEKSRRYAEQCAALVCLHACRVVDKTYGFVPADGARRYQHAIGKEKMERDKAEKRKKKENGQDSQINKDSSDQDKKVKCKKTVNLSVEEENHVVQNELANNTVNLQHVNGGER
ncbi:dihydrouridine synthase 2 [Oratosquilla oratoria]|uniref:dihydrouridine synthase 2 n=1 Tax=Oratosquilla oratoria TaxID=337810 RepID=UPI003F75F388